MAQNNLAVRFTHQQVWTLQSDPKLFVPDYYVQKKPDYILLDTRDGQNPNNHFLIKDLSSLLKALQQDSNYKIAYATEEQFLFHRIK